MSPYSSRPPETDPDSPTPADPAERSLERGLRREPLSEEAYARIRTAVKSEWLLALPVSARSWRRGIAMAAGVAAIAILAAAWFQPAAGAAVFGTVVRADAGGLVKVSSPFTSRTLNPGTALIADETFKARGSALVALDGGGTLRIAHGSVVEAHSLNEIELQEGLIYVDLPPGLPRHRPAFVVRTSLGSIEHVGTQFEVATAAHAVRVRVREGEIRILRPQGRTETATAGTEIVVPQSGPVTRRTVSTHGNSWSWVEALAPDYEIENQQLVDFLRWAARETGRPLELADDHAREVAERTLLHGTVDGLTPLEAIGRVISTTTLRFDLQENTIRVSSGR